MSATNNIMPTVEDLRREIDVIDCDIQALLERRADIVIMIGSAKKSGGAVLPGNSMRPGREAEIIRRVVERHKGALPVGVLTGLWRGMISAYLRMQYPFTVHVATGLSSSAQAGFALWDLARVHFGPATPLEASVSAADVIARVGRDDHALGVIALAYGGDWWLHLPTAAPAVPQVVSRLPFVELAPGQPAALVIACTERDESSEDVTLLRLKAATEAELADLAKALGAEIIARQGNNALLAAPGYLTPGSPALAAFTAKGCKLDIIGGYAAPIRLKLDAQS